MSHHYARVTILGGLLLVIAGCASAPWVAQKPPPMPAAPTEVQTAQPGPNYAWIPGHYEWRTSERTYVWVPGAWTVPPSGQTWVPGRWETRPEGSVWVDSHWQATPSVARPPMPPPMPAARTEVQTAQPGPNYVWIPGHYEWRTSERTYVWVPGSWAVQPAGYIWVPGRWETRPEGSVWVQGHWQRT
jgi:WXXGXW repeat (2 copies)